MVGRETGWFRFRVCRDMKKLALQATITEETEKAACIFTDENRSYLWLENVARSRKDSDHSTTRAETGSVLNFCNACVACSFISDLTRAKDSSYESPFHC